MTDAQTLTVSEVADRLRVSTATVTNWLRDGRLRGYRIGGTKAGWRIEVSDLEQYIADRKGETSVADVRRNMTDHQDALEEGRQRIRGEQQ